MPSIDTYCTIVNLFVEKTGERGTILAVQPSGWDEPLVIKTITKANTYFTKAKANVTFVLKSVKTIEMQPPPPRDGRVDDRVFDSIATRLGADFNKPHSFTPGKVQVAFVRQFSGAKRRGGSLEAYCFAAVQLPLSGQASEAPEVLAHEFGHLVGLQHDCSDQSRLMHDAWVNGANVLTRSERATISAHPHVNRNNPWNAAAEDLTCK